MLNEEDHIRFQVMYAAFSLDEAYRTANEIDNCLSDKLNFAFDDRIGYLTQDPTIIGTGMKASVVLHLPGLAAAMQIPKLISTVQKLGLTLRGSYGEGAAAKGPRGRRLRENPFLVVLSIPKRELRCSFMVSLSDR